MSQLNRTEVTVITGEDSSRPAEILLDENHGGTGPFGRSSPPLTAEPITATTIWTRSPPDTNCDAERACDGHHASTGW